MAKTIMRRKHMKRWEDKTHLARILGKNEISYANISRNPVSGQYEIVLTSLTGDRKHHNLKISEGDISENFIQGHLTPATYTPVHYAHKQIPVRISKRVN
ncbi:hypothetical protein GOV13_04505 [Candidatus Pacearchaeota archaeon]|nr:hypothetical protein [Candidatus Pacearchaeota archaeon]